ncbi:unnamed protein product [Heligmosomoides polygyrus]|uniref:U4/U6.U5 small nuclear ribonucleoprotein 27 kDa protein n=1 Tax=Heligmosomoides polygyrus TaxID=6339 RepID=A0A183GEY1_HELPZ|nr:unnamed protein product [Heligmosomoides polygyrus]
MGVLLGAEMDNGLLTDFHSQQSKKVREGSRRPRSNTEATAQQGEAKPEARIIDDVLGAVSVRLGIRESSNVTAEVLMIDENETRILEFRLASEPIPLDEIVNCERDVAALMDFTGFNTTKNEKVQVNHKCTVKIKKTRRYRHYMNRKGEFNHPLDYIA